MSSSGFRAKVRIQTPPRYDPAIGAVVPADTFGFDSAVDDPSESLLSIRTSKRLDQPCGQFTLTFAPVKVRGGLYWSEVLPAYSMVEISLQRHPEPEPRLVMIGLVDRGEITEDYASAAPQRSVTIHGREAGCLFVDQKVLYLPAPPVPMVAGEVDQSRVQISLPPLYDETRQLLGMLAIDPELALEGSSPVDVLDRFVRMATTGFKTERNPNALPLLDLRLPKRTLADLIVFDRAKADRLLFDRNARLPASSQEIRSDISIWELAETWCDPNYQELWTRTVEAFESEQRTSHGDVIEVVFRRRPYGGRFVSETEVVAPPVAGSQFDPDFVADPAENVEFTPNEVFSRSAGWDASRTRNLYYVVPQVPGLNDDNFTALFQPLADVGEGSPSDIRRLGLRSMKVRDYYFAEGPSSPPERALARAKLLWAWHRFDGIMQSGGLQVVGHPKYEVGKRLVEFEGGRPSREAYVTGVSHAVLLSGRSPTFRTNLQYERGWPLR